MQGVIPTVSLESTRTVVLCFQCAQNPESGTSTIHRRCEGHRRAEALINGFDERAHFGSMALILSREYPTKRLLPPGRAYRRALEVIDCCDRAASKHLDAFFGRTGIPSDKVSDRGDVSVCHAKCHHHFVRIQPSARGHHLGDRCVCQEAAEVHEVADFTKNAAAAFLLAGGPTSMRQVGPH